jgi:hypothetical protein
MLYELMTCFVWLVMNNLAVSMIRCSWPTIARTRRIDVIVTVLLKSGYEKQTDGRPTKWLCSGTVSGFVSELST